MRGSIHKRNETWRYSVYIGRDPLTGKKKYKAKQGFRTKKECENAMNKLINQINEGEYFEEKTYTLLEYKDKWLDNIKATITETTYEFYKQRFKIICKELGNVKLKQLTPMLIQNYLTKQLNTVSSSTVRHNYNVLNIALNQAVK